MTKHYWRAFGKFTKHYWRASCKFTKHYWHASCKFIKLQNICIIHATLFRSFTKAMPLIFHQAPEAHGAALLIIYQLQIDVYLVMIYIKIWLHIV
jgi:hypothetical protein